MVFATRITIFIFFAVTLSAAWYPDQFWWLFHTEHNGPRWWMNVVGIATMMLCGISCLTISITGDCERTGLFPKTITLAVFIAYSYAAFLFWQQYGSEMTMPNKLAFLAPVSLIATTSWIYTQKTK